MIIERSENVLNNNHWLSYNDYQIIVYIQYVYIYMIEAVWSFCYSCIIYMYIYIETIKKLCEASVINYLYIYI